MREYLILILVACASSFLLTGLARRVALRTGALAKVRDRDVHTVPIPYFGGLAMFSGVAVAFLLAFQLPFLSRNADIERDAVWVLVGAFVVLVVGVLDDLIELRPIAKFAGQILAAAIVSVAGVRMLWVPLPDWTISLDPTASILITVVFIVMCTNAVNFVDGLDGLATGVVLIGASAFFLYAYSLTVQQQLQSRATTAALITAALAGACLGFLPHNFDPARIFMGDSGALLLGFLLATATISLTGQLYPAQLSLDRGNLLPVYLPLLLPILVMALPLLDLVWAYIRRTIRGTWWFVADKQHLHHRLLERGHSRRRAVLVMYAWSALVSFGSIIVGLSSSWWALMVVLLLAGGLLIITLRKPRKPAKDGVSLVLD